MSTQAAIRPTEPANAAPAIARAAPAMAQSRFSARLHESLESAEPAWRRLQQDGACTVYQTFSWASCIAQHLAPAQGAKLAIVEVQDASAECALLFPMILRRKGGQRRIEWLGLGVCDYVGPVMRRGLDLSDAEAQAVWRIVKAALPTADVIHISGIPETVFGEANPLARLPLSRPTDLQAFGIAMDGDPATVLQRVCKSSFAADMRKAERKFAKFADFRSMAAGTEAEVEEIFAALIEQRRKRFSEIGRFDILNGPEYVAFYRAAALEGLKGGPARLTAVKADGEWVAASMGLVHNGAFHGVLLGMAGPKWRSYTPGLYVIAETLKWARGQGLDYFDMTVGSLPYKEGLGGKSRQLMEYFEPLSLRGHAFHRARQVATEAVRRIKANEKTYAMARKAAQFGRKTLTRLKGAAK